MRLAFIILDIRIALQTHTVLLTAAVAITHHHVIARTVLIAVAVGSLRALLLALQAEEARLAVLTANAMIKVVFASTLTITHQTTVALAVTITALASHTLQTEVALHAVHALALRTPSLVALALSRSLDTGLALAVVAGRARGTLLSEEAGETLLALLGRIEALLIAIHAHAVRAAHVHLQLGIVVLLFLAKIVNANVELAVIAPLRMVFGDSDIGKAVTGGRIGPEVVMHGSTGSRGHIENDIGIVLIDALDSNFDGAVGLLVEVEVGVDTVGEGLEIATARDIRTKDKWS